MPGSARLADAQAHSYALAAELPPARNRTPNRKPQTTLYLLERGRLTKIGITGNLRQRIGDLERAAGLPIERRWHVVTPHAVLLEARQKRIWWPRKALGEWYRIGFDDAVEELVRAVRSHR